MNNKTLFLTVGGIAALAFTVAMFAFCRCFDAIFWQTYLFVLIGIIFVSVSAAFMDGDNNHFASNLTFVTIPVVYLIVCVMVSIIGAGVLNMTASAYFALHFALLATFTCLWLVAGNASKYINKQDKK